MTARDPLNPAAKSISGHQRKGSTVFAPTRCTGSAFPQRPNSSGVLSRRLWHKWRAGSRLSITCVARARSGKIVTKLTASNAAKTSARSACEGWAAAPRPSATRTDPSPLTATARKSPSSRACFPDTARARHEADQNIRLVENKSFPGLTNLPARRASSGSIIILELWGGDRVAHILAESTARLQFGSLLGGHISRLTNDLPRGKRRAAGSENGRKSRPQNAFRCSRGAAAKRASCRVWVRDVHPARSARIKYCSDPCLPNRSRMIPPIGSRTSKIVPRTDSVRPPIAGGAGEFADKVAGWRACRPANLIPAKLD